MNIKQASKLLRLSTRTVRRLIKSNRISAHLIGPGYRRNGEFEIDQLPVDGETITVENLKECLGISLRSAQRICKKIGTRKIGKKYRLTRNEFVEILRRWHN